MSSFSLKDLLNSIELTQQLIRCPSITPQSAGSIELVTQWLETLGFTLERYDREDTQNIWATTVPGRSPALCFLGHLDVVPPGPLENWSTPPFAAEVRKGVLYGRGVVDMKGGVSAFISAIAKLKTERTSLPSLAILLTTDEEGPGHHGIPAVIPHLLDTNQMPEAILVGEPSSDQKLGDTLRVGRRGSLSGSLTVTGKQGHVAYPDQFHNPLTGLLTALQSFKYTPFEKDHLSFPATALEITGIETSSMVSNMTPEQARGIFSLRFSPAYTGEEHLQRLNKLLAPIAQICPKLSFTLETSLSGRPFYTEEGPLRTAMKEALSVHSITPNEDTGGGTSDGRHFAAHCPVIELGLRNQFAHAIDEQTPVADIEKLSKIYTTFLEKFFLFNPLT